MSDFQAWANALIVDWSGQEAWRDNFVIGAAAVVFVAVVVGLLVKAAK